MDFSLIEEVLRLSVFETTVFLLAGCLIAYSALSRRIHILLFILVLSAAFVGSSIRGVENTGGLPPDVASLSRFLSIALLLVCALGHDRMRLSAGCVLFLGYVGIGLVSLFQAINLGWQLQRGILLVLLVVTIVFVYSDRNYNSVKASLIAISVAGAAFCLLNFTALPGQIGKAARFSGYFKGAPAYALVLGGLLPFTLWGTWRAGSSSLRIISGLGFLTGIVMLTLSGQRTGTLAGVIGTIPLLLTLLRRQTIAWLLLLVMAPVLSGYFWVQHGGAAREEFLVQRYSSPSDLSGRTSIWNEALSEIDKHPLLGRGIGASENVIRSSFHNTYLEVWFNSGLLGLFLFVAAQAFFFWRSWELIRRSKSAEIMSLGALAFGYMMGFVVICMFESAGAGASNVNIILFFLLGVIVSNRKLATDMQIPNVRGNL